MMMEIFDGLNNLSIEELHLVIARSQELLELKEKEALRLAQLEKERLERERLEKERKRLEEIEELKRRLQELEAGGEAAPIPEVKPEPTPAPIPEVKPEPTPAPIPEVKPEPTPTPIPEVKSEPAPKKEENAMISCVKCHKMMVGDSRFCPFCGTPVEAPKPRQKAEVKPAAPKKELEPVQFMDGSISKWVVFQGEQDIFSWKQIKMSSPEEGSRMACYLKLTNRRILISSESTAKAGVRMGAFGALGSMMVEEKGKPWIAMPLGAIDYFKRMDKDEMVIQADRRYVFKLSKADELYIALKSVMPEQAQ